MRPAGWDEANPSASFRAFAEFIHNHAKEVMVQDKTHAELLFFMPLNGQGHIVPARFEDRDLMAEQMKKHITEYYIFGVVHICECWMRLAKEKNDQTLRQIMDGEVKVSELREEERTEGLSVIAQSRAGYSMAWLDEIVRDKKTGRISLKPALAIQDVEGRFGKLFG